MNTDGTDRRSQVLCEVEAAYSEWSDAISRFVMRSCGNRDDSEDILVETFAEAFRQWDAFKGTGSRRNWLYGIAANRVRMHRRRQRLAPDQLDSDVSSSGSISVDLILLRQEIAKLPPSQREAFLLVKSEGLTAREAADILGRPIGTVLYEIHRAAHSLRNVLEGRTATLIAHSCQVEK